MDGGRRLLRPLSALARDKRDAARGSAWRARRRGRRSFVAKLAAKCVSTRFDSGAALGCGLMAAAFLAGLSVNGGMEGFTAQYGAPRDLLARIAGFPLDVVTITGQKELSEIEILEQAELTSRNSLPFLDAALVRERLKAMPLVKEASVRKLYPDRLVIEITERNPYALWQHDGEVSIIARDGMVIDRMRDGRFNDLPFVSGVGANTNIDEYVALLDDAGDLRSKIRAGMRVADRRWTLKMTSGVEVMLPEKNPAEALAVVARLERENRVLQKDVLSLDMRVAGRMTARLGEDAYQARLEAKTRKTGRSRGGET